MFNMAEKYFRLKMFLTVTLFLVFINQSSAQHWCPGSSIPAVCCSKLLDGTITDDYAKFEVSFLSPMYGYTDIEIDVERLTLEECYGACKVSRGFSLLNMYHKSNFREHYLQGLHFLILFYIHI